VPAEDVAKVEAMDDGAFICQHCDPSSRFVPLPEDEQEAWKTEV